MKWSSGGKNVCRPNVGAGLLDSLRASTIPAASAVDCHQAQGNVRSIDTRGDIDLEGSREEMG